ncbi:high choriolytic enzyme 1-like [Parambassis ranga]|uniref:Metalloendopeptidase n=1 Tax=Parambassis ranga TaxID=210632 RepID=A0A6P7HR88_9TELE|nr:high choriolytic enzyme 1-like [Parambassis ranga]
MKPTILLLVLLSMTAAALSASISTPAVDRVIDKSDISGIMAKGSADTNKTDASEAISKANADSKTPLLYGDIKAPSTKNAVLCTSSTCRWPKYDRYVYVPVAISSQYTPTEQDIIIRALLTFHQSTCIRFVWRTTHRDYLYFFSGDGCWSLLGRQTGGQYVSLKKAGCLFQSTVQHEVLHALGFHHEQVRSDRDQYVQILYQNILSGQESNFQKTATNNLGTPYDFNSVMHYNKYAFSKNGQPTILAKSNPNLDFGRATNLSANDIARVNRLYQC